jgi:hypothetical protein
MGADERAAVISTFLCLEALLLEQQRDILSCVKYDINRQALVPLNFFLLKDLIGKQRSAGCATIQLLLLTWYLHRRLIRNWSTTHTGQAIQYIICSLRLSWVKEQGGKAQQLRARTGFLNTLLCDNTSDATMRT